MIVNFKSHKTRIAASVAVAVSTLALSGCFGGGSSSAAKPPVDPTVPPVQPVPGTQKEVKELSSPVQIVFKSTTGERINGTTFSISAGNLTVSDVLEVSGAKLVKGNEFVQTSDIVLVSRKSGTEDLDFRLTASRDGFFANNINGTLPNLASLGNVSSTVSNLYTVTLTPSHITSTELAASSVEVKASVSDTGVIQEKLELATPDKDSVAGGTVKLSVPEGTVLKDRDGNAIVGNITANAVYFSHDPENGQGENSVLTSFPGSLTPDSVLGENGQPDAQYDDIFFVSAGFAAIELSGTNTEGEETVVSTLSGGGVELAMTIPETTRNPETGAPIKPGDVIPVWSYDEVEGQWKAEGTSRVGEKTSPESTVYPLTKEITHLSYYNLDWFGENCQVNATLLDHNGNENKYQLETQFSSAYGYQYERTLYGNLSSLTLANVPKIIGGEVFTGDLSFSETIGGTSLISSIKFSDGTTQTYANGTYRGPFCDLNGAEITLNTESLDSRPTYKVDVSYVETCQDDPSQTRSVSGYTSVYNVTANRYVSTERDGGVSTFPAVQGKEYEVSGNVYYRNGQSVSVEPKTITATEDMAVTFTIKDAFRCTKPATGATGSTGAVGGAGA